MLFRAGFRNRGDTKKLYIKHALHFFKKIPVKLCHLVSILSLFFALENFQQYSSREIHWIQKNKTWCPHQGWLKPLAFRRSKVYDVLGQLAFRDSHESGIDVVIPAKAGIQCR